MAIDTTNITDALNAIWTIIQNVVDHTGTIISLIIIGVIISILYIIVRFLKGVFNKAVKEEK